MNDETKRRDAFADFCTVGKASLTDEQRDALSYLYLAAKNTRDQASAPDETVVWGSATSVGQLIGQLRTLDPAASIHGAYFVDIDGKKVAKVRSVTLSREHVDGNTIRGGDKTVPLQHVIWTQPDTRSNAKAVELVPPT